MESFEIGGQAWLSGGEEWFGGSPRHGEGEVDTCINGTWIGEIILWVPGCYIEYQHLSDF